MQKTDNNCSACTAYQQLANKPLCPKHEEEAWAEIQLEGYVLDIERYEDQWQTEYADRGEL